MKIYMIIIENGGCNAHHFLFYRLKMNQMNENRTSYIRCGDSYKCPVYKSEHLVKNGKTEAPCPHRYINTITHTILLQAPTPLLFPKTRLAFVLHAPTPSL